MGLDSVEIVMSVEDTFQISLPDAEVNSIYTVGALYELVLSKLKVTENDDEQTTRRCLTSTAFYRIRRAIAEVLNVERRKITPKTELRDLLPVDQRQENWSRIEKALGLSMPGLEHYWPIIGWINAAFLTIGIMVGVLIDRAYTLVLPIISILGTALFLQLFPTIKTSLPTANVGSLAEIVAVQNFKQLSDELGVSDKQKIWESLKKIIVEHLGANPDKVIPAARFIEDLNMN